MKELDIWDKVSNIKRISLIYRKPIVVVERTEIETSFFGLINKPVKYYHIEDSYGRYSSLENLYKDVESFENIVKEGDSYYYKAIVNLEFILGNWHTETFDTDKEALDYAERFASLTGLQKITV